MLELSGSYLNEFSMYLFTMVQEKCTFIWNLSKAQSLKTITEVTLTEILYIKCSHTYKHTIIMYPNVCIAAFGDFLMELEQI